MSEERLTAIDKRLDEQRETMSRLVAECHARINVALAPDAWWVKPVKALLYGFLGLSVIGTVGYLMARGFLPDTFIDNIMSLAEERVH